MGLFGLGLAFQLVSAISSLEIPEQIFSNKRLSTFCGGAYNNNRTSIYFDNLDNICTRYQKYRNNTYKVE